MNATRLQGRTALVTGGANGIGLAIAERLLADGAQVALLDLDAQALHAARTAVGDARASFDRCDVSSAADVERAVAAAIARWGSIDVLVNNAGISTSAPFESIPEHDWDRVMAVNAKGAFLCSQRVLPHMREAGRGAIVSIASQAARRGEPLIAHYCASKAAVIGVTRALALEGAPEVRANVVCPGLIDTRMLRSELESTRNPVDLAASIPLGRLQRPEDVAAAVAFLASDDASEITGQTLSVDGGMVMP